MRIAFVSVYRVHSNEMDRMYLGNVVKDRQGGYIILLRGSTLARLLHWLALATR